MGIGRSSRTVVVSGASRGWVVVVVVLVAGVVLVLVLVVGGMDVEIGFGSSSIWLRSFRLKDRKNIRDIDLDRLIVEPEELVPFLCVTRVGIKGSVGGEGRWILIEGLLSLDPTDLA